VFKDERAALGYGRVPGLDAPLSVIRVYGVRPAVTLVLLVALAREGRPARLLPDHPAGCVVGPEHALDRLDRTAKPFVAGAQGRLAERLLDGRRDELRELDQHRLV
jgi:hypothetical protein